MAANLLGRTNQAFPQRWLRPVLSSDTDSATLVRRLLNENTVIDISGNPALWGGHMRGTSAVLMTRGGLEIENATDEAHAAILIQSHLIQTLSAVGREHIDFYFLQVRRPLEEFQISGALQALEMAKQDGHIRFLGIESLGDPLTTLSVWQFHDAFDVLLLGEESPELRAVAVERRVGVVGQGGVSVNPRIQDTNSPPWAGQ